jgi:hypothetical protein
MQPFYGLLVRMHPLEFRSEFGDQMIAIVEEMTAHGASSASIYFDAVVSLARQWLLRSGMLWKALVSLPLAGVMLVVPLKLPPIRPWQIPPDPVSPFPAGDLVKITLAVFGIINVILVATVWWSRVVNKKRRASCHLSYVRSRSATAGFRPSKT